MPVPYAGSMRVRVLVAARRNQPTEHIMKRHITLGLAMLAGQSKSSAAYAMVDIGEMTDPNLIWEQLLPKVTPAPAGGTYGGVGNRVAGPSPRASPSSRSTPRSKELIGNFKNGGTDYRPKGDPLDVNVHDFKEKEPGKVVPHGIYDPTTNAGWVSVGITHDTAEFAVQSTRLSTGCSATSRRTGAPSHSSAALQWSS
jgi:hypothetical protein